MVTTSIQYAEDVPVIFAAKVSWPVGSPVCVKNKKSGNVLATGKVVSPGPCGSPLVMVQVDRRFN